MYHESPTISGERDGDGEDDDGGTSKYAVSSLCCVAYGAESCMCIYNMC